MAKITLREIAAMAQVSVMTVSNVIRGNDARVSAETKEKINQLVKTYNYVPNQNASNLRSGRSSLIGVLLYHVMDYTDPFVSAVLTGISKAARENGYFTMIHSVEEPQNIATLQQNWTFAGFIVVGASSFDFLEIDRTITTPVSYIDTYWREDQPLPEKTRNFVGTDEAKISQTVGAYLQKMGHEKVLFYSFDFDEKEPSVIEKRYRAFKSSFGGSIVKANAPSTNYQEIVKSVRDYLMEQPFTAIYATADILAAKLNQIFKDCSIIGVDNADFADFIAPKLTTVAIDQKKKGEIAVERLLDSLENGTSSTYFSDIELIERDSVRKI